MYHIYVGYEDRTHAAFQTAKYSIEKNSSVPVKVHKLCHKDVRNAGLLTRASLTVGLTGQFIDAVDGRPFSTQFTFSRFLIQELHKQNKSHSDSDLIMFVDSDVLFLEDVGELFKEAEQQRALKATPPPVYCVKHNYKPKNDTKMDGMAQHSYNMKLWAALFILDTTHEQNEALTPALVNTAVGRDLMHFCWLDDVSTIGELPMKWHFLPGHSEKHTEHVSMIHWTEGGPFLPGYPKGRYDEIWLEYYLEYLHTKLELGTQGARELINAE
jgi:hypothetical protein